MDLIDQLRVLASRIASTKAMIQTEEATKNAMVMPFIQALGYNVFDPLEVTPELVADVGTKKGEKVDYAILRDGKPIMLFECKKSGADLNINHAAQLFRYFHVTEARFGVLTNGLVYRFFTEEEVAQLVNAFYARVREDPLIGPVFADHITDWPTHLGKMVDFWSATLRGTARFRGNPMAAHNRIAGVSETHFQRWLALFRQTTQNMENQAMRERADELSLRIAQSLWYGYQLNESPNMLPNTLQQRAFEADSQS